MNKTVKVASLSLVIASCAFVSGCEQTDSEKREQIIGEIIESKVSKICIAYHVEGSKEKTEVLMRRIEACQEIALMAREDKAPTLAAFGMAGVLTLSDKSLELMFHNYESAYIDKQIEEANSTWNGVKSTFSHWFRSGRREE